MRALIEGIKDGTASGIKILQVGFIFPGFLLLISEIVETNQKGL